MLGVVGVVVRDGLVMVLGAEITNSPLEIHEYEWLMFHYSFLQVVIKLCLLILVEGFCS